MALMSNANSEERLTLVSKIGMRNLMNLSMQWQV